MTALRLVPAPAPLELAPEIAFCGYCGHSPSQSDHTATRICAVCELGVVLMAPSDLAPTAGQAAVVVDHTLSVCALSRAGEVLLGMQEPDAVNRHLSELFVPAHAEAKGLESMVSVVVGAARGDHAVRRTVVRPAGIFGVRYVMRVGACGPPRAALLVLDDDEV